MRKKGEGERKRDREREGGARGGYRCANSISPLLVPNLKLRRQRRRFSPPRRGPTTERDGPSPPPLPYPQEGPTAIDPDLHAPNERDCQRKPTCRTRTCGNTVLRCPSRTYFLDTPFTHPSPLPPSPFFAATTRARARARVFVSFILPRRSTAPPALPSSFSYSPNLPNRERPDGSNCLILSFPFPSHHVSPSIHEDPRGPR